MTMEWTDENTRIITKLFAEQVELGNRPNMSLTPNAMEEVLKEFNRRTNLDVKQTQLKNKWDKLRSDYNIWKRLRLRETGGGWDHERNTILQDDEWWKKAKKDIKGCGKFRKHGLRNEEYLKIMFEDINTDGSDHWNPTSGIAPPSSAVVAAALNVDAILDVDLDEMDQESPASARGVKRLGRVIDEKKQKPKTCQVMQDQITKLGDLAERSQSSFEAYMKSEETTTVASVMDKVIACGAVEGSNEHFIATELFIKKDNREMFLHLSEGARLAWLTRKYKIKYGGQ